MILYIKTHGSESHGQELQHTPTYGTIVSYLRVATVSSF